MEEGRAKGILSLIAHSGVFATHCLAKLSVIAKEGGYYETV